MTIIAFTAIVLLGLVVFVLAARLVTGPHDRRRHFHELRKRQMRLWERHLDELQNWQDPTP
jgi:hypothetical protein